MNFKSILVLGLSVATLGLSLPAHADTATNVNNDQNAIITGDDNNTRQTNQTNVNNRQTGRRTNGNTGTSVDNRQNADVQGDYNRTRQDNKTDVTNTQRRTR